MTNTVGIFRYNLVDGRECKVRLTDGTMSDYPASSFVHISLARWSQDDQGLITISPQLMTESAIDWHVNALKEDLDRVGRLAKMALARARPPS